jgi:NAD(P)-dependent dehydrogenase (short-subunit alcohol dehydrogenase family)
MSNFAGADYAILGGSGGIGSEIAEGLIDREASVHLASRDREAYQSFEWTDEASVNVVDAETPRELEDWVHDSAPESGFDGVVNAVGTIDIKPLDRTSYETWERTLEVNLTSCFALLRGYLSDLPDTGGHFLAFSSAAAGQGIPNHGAIAAAKSGVEGLVRSAASTYSHRNFRANCLSPGLVETPLSESITENERSRKQSESMHALDRLGQPEDVAQAALFLLDPSNDWITGQVFEVDGGLRNLNPR